VSRSIDPWSAACEGLDGGGGGLDGIATDARAVDEHGAASDWAAPRVLNAGGCACASSLARPGAGSPLLLLLFLAARRRRSRRNQLI
jgi:hypothetical protein